MKLTAALGVWLLFSSVAYAQTEGQAEAAIAAADEAIEAAKQAARDCISSGSVVTPADFAEFNVGQQDKQTAINLRNQAVVKELQGDYAAAVQLAEDAAGSAYSAKSTFDALAGS